MWAIKACPRISRRRRTFNRKAAAQGNAKAMYNLGYIYYHAQGLPQDDRAGRAMVFKKQPTRVCPRPSLRSGSPISGAIPVSSGMWQPRQSGFRWRSSITSSLRRRRKRPIVWACFMSRALGVPQNVQSALDWFNQGADLGNAKARYNLGRIYMQGGPVKKDPVLSYMWLKMASYQADPLAMHLLTEYLGRKFTRRNRWQRGTESFRSTRPNIL